MPTAAARAVGHDGRLLRTATTRRAILEATQQLLVSRASVPTAEAIADAAGIAKRTLFRHFADLESLHSTLVQEAQANITAVMEEPFKASLEDADWPELLNHVIERRVRVYEHMLPLYVSGIWWRTDAGQQKMLRRRRRRLQMVLPADMASNELLFEALDATLSIEFWISLRRGQKHGVSRAKRVLQHTVQRLTQTC